jgi:ribose transport system permease protein
MKKELGILVILLVVCAVTAAINPQFIGAANLQNNARLIGLYGIFSIGMGIVIITAGIDLSVGSVFALQGVLLVFMLREWHWPWPLAVAAIILGTMVLGALHGFLITRVNLQPFIVTLCGLLFYRGAARFIANDEAKGFGTESYGMLRELATGSVGGVPMPFILLLVIAAIMWVVLHRSVYGRYLFAVGRNEEAARYSGIPSKLIIASAYVVAAALAGIAGILIAFYTNSISPSGHGNFYELYGIAAAVLGGCSLRGGEGSVLGIVIGTALLQVLQNLVNLLGIPSSLNFAVMGGVILMGVLVDQLLAQRREAKRTREGPRVTAKEE